MEGIGVGGVVDLPALRKAGNDVVFAIVGCQAVYTYAGGSGSGGYERSGFERQNTPAPEGFSEIEDDELPF